MGDASNITDNTTETAELQRLRLRGYGWVAPCSVLLMALLLAAPPARAESDAVASLDDMIDIADLSLEEMLEEPVVSTAGKRKQKKSRSVAAVSILTKEDIKAFPYTYVGELLATLPAMDVRWGQMQRLFIGMRGLGGTGLNARTLVLLDGVPVNDPITGDTGLGHFFPSVDIERIEVIRGPGSSLYGANAFSGVVNVLTSEPKGEKFSDRLAVSNLFGSNLTERLQISYGQEVGPVNVGVGVEAFQTDGPFPALRKAEGTGVTTIDNDGVESIAVSGRANYEGLRVAARYLAGERGRPGQFPVDESGRLLACESCHTAESPLGGGRKYSTRSDSCGGCHIQPHDRESVQRATFSASYNHKVGGVELTGTAFHNEWRTKYSIDRESSFLGDPMETLYRHRMRSTGLEVHGVHTQGENELNTVLVGTELRRNEAASDLLRLPNGDNHKIEIQTSLFIEDELRPIDWLSIVAGARFDYNTLHGQALSPRSGLVVAPWKSGAIRLTAGRAYRNPVLGELFVADSKGPTRRIGNPDLKPEWINTFETGLSHTFAKPVVVQASSSLFYSFSNNLIGVRSSGFPNPDATFYNIDDAHVWGGELELSAELPGDLAKGRAFSNYSYQRAEDGDGVRLPYAPSSKFNLGVISQLGSYATSARASYRSKRKDSAGISLPSVLTVDLSVATDLAEGFDLQLWATNLFDEAYQDSLGIPGARRSLFVILGYSGAAGDSE